MTEYLIRGAYPLPIDTRSVQSKWSDEGFSFGEFNDPPGQEWNDFVHGTDEYVLVSEGMLQIDVGSERFVAESGDLIRIPRNVNHSLKTVSPDGSVWLYGYGYWSGSGDGLGYCP